MKSVNCPIGIKRDIPGTLGGQYLKLRDLKRGSSVTPPPLIYNSGLIHNSLLGRFNSNRCASYM